LEAVQIASSRRYNIILMDCNMPIMDGWQVWISERNRNTRNWKTAVVFMQVLYNYMYLHKTGKIFLDVSIRIRAEMSECIYHCALRFLMYVRIHVQMFYASIQKHLYV
jgi:hypothetical protein